MFADIVLPYDKKVNYRTFDEDMLIKAIDNYLKINGVRKKYHSCPSCWFHYARSGRFARICNTESFKFIERSFVQIYTCVSSRKIVFSHRKFSEILSDCDVVKAREPANYIIGVPFPSPTVESMEPTVIDVADIYSECYKAFMGWYEDYKSFYATDTVGFTIVDKTVNVIENFTKTNGFGMDVPAIMSSNFYGTYWRMICIINMLAVMMSWGLPAKSHTCSDSVETNDVEEEEED